MPTYNLQPLGSFTEYIGVTPSCPAAMAFVSYSFWVFPDAFPGPSHYAPAHQSLLAVGVITLFPMIHAWGLQVGTRIQNVFTGFKIGWSFCGGWIASGEGSMDHFLSVQQPGTLFSAGFASSLIFISFAYSEWKAVDYLGAEIKNPARNLPPCFRGPFRSWSSTSS